MSIVRNEYWNRRPFRAVVASAVCGLFLAASLASIAAVSPRLDNNAACNVAKNQATSPARACRKTSARWSRPCSPR